MAIEVLGKTPDAGMGEVASAAGVVRRTVYGYFPSRSELVVALRRGEFGADIHALLGTVEQSLAALVARGQDSGAFGRHLPAASLSQAAWSAVFTLADDDLHRTEIDVSAVITTSLLMLGVPASRAKVLAER